ncbi:MAG: hypothetical protein JSS55_06335 [Proteobacteria bacterium]|nr:hypothetical protein [Pseudomonadota bacterium]
MLERIEHLSARLEQADADKAVLAGRIEEARAEGQAAGRAAALTEFEDDRTEALALLGRALETLVEQWEAKLSGIEGAAHLIAIATLEKLIGDAAGCSDFVAAAISHQLKVLDRSAVRKLSVSRIDFPSRAEVAELVERLGQPAVIVEVLDDMDQGLCEAELRLGRAEIGPATQWRELRAIIEEHAEPAVCK